MYSLSCTTAPYWAWKYLSFWQDRNKNSCTWKSSVQFSPQPPSVELRYLWWSTITQYYKYVCTSLPLPVFPDLWNTNIPFHRVFYCGVVVVGIGVQLLLISATAVHLLTVLVHSWSVQYHLETSEEGRGRGRSSVGGWKSNSSVPLMICFYLDWASGTFVLESIFGNGFCKDDVGVEGNENKTEAAAGFFLFLPTTETQIFSVWFRPWSSSWVCTTHSTAVSVYFSHFLGLHSSVTIIVPNHGGRSTLTRIRPWPCGKCFYQTLGNANVSLEMLSVLSESLVRKHEPIRVNSTLRQHLHSVYDKLR